MITAFTLFKPCTTLKGLCGAHQTPLAASMLCLKIAPALEGPGNCITALAPPMEKPWNKKIYGVKVPKSLRNAILNYSPIPILFLSPNFKKEFVLAEIYVCVFSVVMALTFSFQRTAICVTGQAVFDLKL